MDKKVRKAVRTFLIQNNKVITTKYKTKTNFEYYDIPGGKIEDGKIRNKHRLENLEKKQEYK